jgi:hypothetical protein
MRTFNSQNIPIRVQQLIRLSSFSFQGLGVKLDGSGKVLHPERFVALDAKNVTGFEAVASISSMDMAIRCLHGRRLRYCVCRRRTTPAGHNNKILQQMVGKITSTESSRCPGLNQGPLPEAQHQGTSD